MKTSNGNKKLKLDFYTTGILANLKLRRKDRRICDAQQTTENYSVETNLSIERYKRYLHTGTQYILFDKNYANYEEKFFSELK